MFMTRMNIHTPVEVSDAHSINTLDGVPALEYLSDLLYLSHSLGESCITQYV